ncbi:MAG: hypothetical protein QOF67_847 [Mycobacterium sp.]|nr:hypothetical protein [Mycobacterium sp.]
MVEREASGDFDYLWEDPADSDGLTSGDEVVEVQAAEELESPPKDPGDDLWDEPDDNLWGSGHFDAFDDITWHFTPAPPPWYRTKQALTAIVAASAAVAAIVVSGVLLVFRGVPDPVDEVTVSVSPTASTSAERAPVITSAEPLPSPPPPPPPETATPVDTAPRYNPTYQPRPTKAPEIGVTRTPVTRAPISVAPQPRTGQNGLR